MPFEPRDPDLDSRVRESFARQRVMQTIGASLTDVTPGSIRITLPFREDLTQQHGYLHAGIVTTVMDSAWWVRRSLTDGATSGCVGH